MSWHPMRPDDGPAVYPHAPYYVTVDSPDGQWVQGRQTWLGVFRTVAFFAVDGDHIHVRPIEDEDIVEIAIRYRPSRNEMAAHAGVREFAEGVL